MYTPNVASNISASWLACNLTGRQLVCQQMVWLPFTARLHFPSRPHRPLIRYRTCFFLYSKIIYANRQGVFMLRSRTKCAFLAGFVRL